MFNDSAEVAIIRDESVPGTNVHLEVVKEGQDTHIEINIVSTHNMSKGQEEDDEDTIDIINDIIDFAFSIFN